MNIKKLFIGLISFFAFTQLFAVSLSVQILQFNPGQDKVWETSQVVEQSIIDFFFENGFVVSNSPVFLSTDAKTDRMEIRKSVEDARQGRLEYFAEVKINYNENITTNSDSALLSHVKNVHWRIYDSNNGNVLSEGDVIPEKVTPKNDDEYSVILLGQDIAMEIKSNIKVSAW